MTSEPPKLELVAGRNLGFDALAKVCGYNVGRKQDAVEVAVGLNGSRKTGPGIRAELWRELQEARELGLDPKTHDAFRPFVRSDPESETEWFERGLAGVIERRADLYRRKMPGATLTPTALAKWWGRLPSMPDPSGQRVSAADVLRG